ncbi:DUF302 domain-containing protein [Pontiella sp.]|uniref:DUF302 domain-containing protein n=1 Tax=Pontiella sp. TaxID=2837462 RepID=UPI003564684F
MKPTITGLIIGLALGIVIVALVMPKLMVSEKVSPLGYDETIAHITRKAEAAGWKVSADMRLDKSLAKENKEVLPVASLKICQPDYAEKVLLDDEARFLSVMMPCSIAVYEKADGKTYISTMNAGLMGRMFGGTAQSVMGGPVAKETREFVTF